MPIQESYSSDDIKRRKRKNSNLIDKEEEIASKAYELVEHAINLIETKYYDDAIGVLLQAIGFYSQINREEEIKAILRKISEIQRLKEHQNRKLEAQTLINPEELQQNEYETIGNEENIILVKAMNLIDEAEKAVKNYEVRIKTKVLLYKSPYEKVISNYNEAKKLFQEIGWNDEAARLINTIKFYNEKKEKDENLREIEKKKLEKPEVELIAAKTITNKVLFDKEKKISENEKKKKFEEKFVKAEELQKRQQEAKRKEFLKMQSEKQWEREISEEAYELLKQGTSLVDNKKFDEAYTKYIEARNLFNKISWKREVSRINIDLLFKLKREIKN